MIDGSLRASSGGLKFQFEVTCKNYHVRRREEVIMIAHISLTQAGGSPGEFQFSADQSYIHTLGVQSANRDPRCEM